jgi:hypothetical protein
MNQEAAGEWVTFRELAAATDISWNKLRWLRDNGGLTDLGIVLYQKRCRTRSRWWAWVPFSALCHNRLRSLPSKAEYSSRNASKT